MTKSIKKSVMFSGETVDYIKARTREDAEVSWTASLNSAFQSLKWATSQSLPKLSENDWDIIFSVYSGCIIDLHPPLRVASDIMDDAGAISLEELQPRTAELVKKVHAMSQIEQFAILDTVQKFWANSWNDEGSLSEIIEKIKAL